MPDIFGQIVDRVAELAAAMRATPHFEWGTVVTSAPLTVRLDGDTDPLLGTPSKVITDLYAGERVLVMIQNRRPTIVARAETSEWLPITPSTGWTPVSGHTPRCRVVAGVLWMEGAFLRGAGGDLANIGTLPASLPLSGGKTVFVGGHTARKSDGVRAHAEIYISMSSRTLQSGVYQTLDSAAGWVVPITGSILANQL